MRSMDQPSNKTADQLLFLTDDQIRQSIELMFFAYRSFTKDPDKILAKIHYGRAHHRAIHFINRRPGLTVSELIEVLGITKQSLNRVLRQLVDEGLVRSEIGIVDKRQRHLYLTDTGIALEHELSDAQRLRMRRAFAEAGPEAVQGFRQVLRDIAGSDLEKLVQQFVDGRDL